MTIAEFKAFLEGMDVQEAPTPEQWERIVEKLAKLCDSGPVLVPNPLKTTTYMQDPDDPFCRVTC